MYHKVNADSPGTKAPFTPIVHAFNSTMYGSRGILSWFLRGPTGSTEESATESLLQHAYRFREKEVAARTFTTWGRISFVAALVSVIALLLSSIFVPFVTIAFRGLVGVLARWDDSQDGGKEDQPLAIVDLPTKLISQAIANASSNVGDQVGLIFCAVWLTLLAGVSPLLCMLIATYSALRPLSLRSQKIAFVVIETLQNWAALDVLIVVALLGLSPMGYLFELIQLEICTTTLQPLLQQTLVPLGILKDEETYCYYVYCNFQWGTAFALGVALYNFFYTQLVLRLFETAISNRSARFRLRDVDVSHYVDHSHTRPFGHELMSLFNYYLLAFWTKPSRTMVLDDHVPPKHQLSITPTTTPRVVAEEVDEKDPSRRISL